MAITTSKSQAVATSLTRIMRNEIRMTPNIWPMLSTRVPSNSDQETYGWLGDVPNMKEFLGERVFEELRAMNYSIVNKDFQQSVGLNNNVVDDDRYGLYTPAVRLMSQKATRHPDKLLAELIVDAESAVCYDGQPFYDTAHVEGDSGTQTNLLTYNASDHTAVTAAEFLAAFHAALKKLFTYKTDQGDFFIEPEAVGFSDGDLKVLVPMALWEAADKAMEQALVGSGESAHRLRKAQVVPLIRMGTEVSGGSDVKFDLIYTGGPIRPFIFQDRSALVAQAKGVNDIEDNIIKLMTKARHNVGFGLWQFAVRTEFN